MIFVLLYGLLAADSVAELSFPSQAWVFVSIALYIYFIRTLFARNLTSTVILLPIVITKLLVLLSLIFISQGFVIRELGLVGGPPVYSGYFALLGCAFLHLTAGISTVLNRSLAPRPLAPFPILQIAFTLAVIAAGTLAIGVLLYSGMTQGFALLNGVDRFDYRASQGWLFNIVINFKPILAGLMGFARFRLPTTALTRPLLSFLLVMLIISSALSGDKFLSLLILLAFYFTPYLILSGGLNRRTMQRTVTIGSVSLIMASALTYYVYSDYGTLNQEQTTTRLFGRFTGQGQLWYIVNHRGTELTAIDEVESQKLMQVMTADDADQLAFDTHTGIFHMVEVYGEEGIRHSVFNRDGLIQFTGATEAYLINVYGQIYMIFIVLALSLAAAASAYYIYNSLISGSLLGYFFSTFIMANFASMMNQASFWQVFGKRALIYFSIMIAIDMGLRVFFAGRILAPADDVAGGNSITTPTA